MPAVTTGYRSPIPSWVDADDVERITEVTDVAERFRLETHGAQVERAVLVRLDGDCAGEVVAFDGETLTVGRHVTNQFQLDDPGISRFHAQFAKRDGEYFVDDLESRNGTFVSAERHKTARLRNGAIVQLGPRVTFRFSLLDPREERMLRQLYESSTLDALTGVYNRKYLDARLESEVAFARRHQTSMALILFDIDHFKRVNDTHGHSVGDMVLRHVARTCQRCLRTEDVLARFGGEEFAVLPRGVSLRGAAKLADRLRHTVAESAATGQGGAVSVTISLGCAELSPTDPASPSALVEAADRRLYRAKELGRNRVVWDGPRREPASAPD